MNISDLFLKKNKNKHSTVGFFPSSSPKHNGMNTNKEGGALGNVKAFRRFCNTKIIGCNHKTFSFPSHSLSVVTHTLFRECRCEFGDALMSVTRFFWGERNVGGKRCRLVAHLI